MTTTTTTPFRWPAGFRLGATARAARRPDTEGRIVGLDPPGDPLDVAMVEIRRSGDGTRVFTTLRGCEVRGVDYAQPPPDRAPRRRRRPNDGHPTSQPMTPEHEDTDHGNP